MKKTSIAISSLCSGALILPSAASAFDIGGFEVTAQPRVEAGVLYYEYEQDAVTEAVASTSETFGRSFSQESFRFKDTNPFAGGGLTVFVDRLFFDFSALTTLENFNDGDSIGRSEFVEGDAPLSGFDTRFSSVKPNVNADFDRDDYAISLGFAVTEQIAVFAGYKWAETDFNTKGEGTANFLFTPGLFPDNVAFDPEITNVEGTITEEIDFEFEYDGPFVGVNYGLDVNAGFLEGALSFNFAAAFLDADINIERRPESVVTITSIDGIGRENFGELEVEDFRLDDPTAVAVDSDGDTIGLTFGVGWRGFTPLEGVTYSVNVSGYKYTFDADGDSPDIDETALAFKLGLAYAF